MRILEEVAAMEAHASEEAHAARFPSGGADSRWGEPRATGPRVDEGKGGLRKLPIDTGDTECRGPQVSDRRTRTSHRHASERIDMLELPGRIRDSGAWNFHPLHCTIRRAYGKGHDFRRRPPSTPRIPWPPGLTAPSTGRSRGSCFRRTPEH
jgi:hypothetical protein